MVRRMTSLDGTRADAHGTATWARACSGLFDVDRLLAAIATHKQVLVLLLGAGLMAVPSVSAAASAVIGVGPGTELIVFALLWAAVVVPAHHWLRAHDTQALHEARVAQHALRRYVPGAVAAQLERGGTVECGVREVTVLFTDICGFTTLSEGRTAAEIFSTVSQYTQAVSEI